MQVSPTASISRAPEVVGRRRGAGEPVGLVLQSGLGCPTSPLAAARDPACAGPQGDQCAWTQAAQPVLMGACVQLPWAAEPRSQAEAPELGWTLPYQHASLVNLAVAGPVAIYWPGHKSP